MRTDVRDVDTWKVRVSVCVCGRYDCVRVFVCVQGGVRKAKKVHLQRLL